MPQEATTRPFIHDDFLLQNVTARRIYHEVAAGLPIIDYHSHLPAGDIASDRQYDNLYQLWLEGDHYKWRAMRACGVDEHYITGAAGEREKFLKWAETVPKTLGNPLYHWTHLELKRFFGIDALFGPENAEQVWEQTREMLQQPDFSTRGLLRRMKVEVICTTDEPADKLYHHKKIAQQTAGIRVFPSFRPDALYAFGDVAAWNAGIDRLGISAGKSINTLDDALDALQERVHHFDAHGALLSDHGLSRLQFSLPLHEAAARLFGHLRGHQPLNDFEQQQLNSFFLVALGRMYHKRNWAQQFHIGAFRAVNSRMSRITGPNAGFDSIADYQHGPALAGLLDALDKDDTLPRSILYNLNPADTAVFASMAGNFNDGSTPGKVQYGPAWWFLDQKDGIEAHLDAVSNFGLLSQFVGMLTDSRSFLSFSRHEYFRRVFCNWLGQAVERGELPQEADLLNDLVGNVCYYNAKRWFKL